MENIEEKRSEMRNKMRVLEDRNRRNNLRIDGMKESRNESWEECEEKIKGILRSKLGIDRHVEIERAHRMGRYNERNENPRTIIFKLLNWKDRETILNNSNRLKDTGIFINEDFSDATMEIRKELRKEKKKHREAGKYSVIVYDRSIVQDFKNSTYINFLN